MANSGFTLRKSLAMTSGITEKSTIPKMHNISNNISSVAKMVDKNKGSGVSERMVSAQMLMRTNDVGDGPHSSQHALKS